ncbi:MAG: hypothetical protein I3273_00740 [Candidatus Moeniiplasma glomeromycotorum]|nr:hypothetical protein [Candidatus Moeniiplasma glomeromycotorum]MCE8167350.1 hypothetical protein [Candidatus Moeniiplasma glomeromycotorum]MCE8168637.1 hypothetical protein [Candidatus Moeniiplasma glomeromycotorum]
MVSFSLLKFQEIVDKDNLACSSFVFQDLPLVMGTALGNLLRQILLNHLSGIAPLAVEISDQNGPVKSKFSVLAGVAENGITAYLILKLKEIILVEVNSADQKEAGGFFTLRMNIENKTKKEKTITVADFSIPPQVEIKNPELELAVLSPGGKLDLKMYCQKNWGYHSEEEQKNHFLSQENAIVFDTDYSPLKGGQVSFYTEPNKFQKKEKLTLNIQSRGWITPFQALEQTLVITKNLFTSLNELLEKKVKVKKTTKAVLEGENR